MATQTPELTRLMDNARIHVPGALDDTLKLELFNTLDDFLQRSLFWQEEIDYTVSVGRKDYEIVGTEVGQICSLLSNVNSNGASVAATMPNAGTVLLDLEPSEVEEYTAKVAYTVVDPTETDSYPTIPDGLLVLYGVGILAGLIGRMMMQPAKPYSNERMGILNMRKFNGAIATARAAVQHANLFGGQTWRFPSCAVGTQR